MSIERLLASLERSTELEAERLGEAARSEAARLTDEAGERRRMHREAALADRSATWRAENAKRLAEARRRARAEVAAARQRLIERVFGRARAGFADAIRSDAYAAALPHQLEEAFGYLGDRSATVRCPQALETAVRSLIGARRAVTVKADDETAPGIVVQTDDGSLTIDVTLEGRLGAMGAVLALDIVAAAQLPKS